MGTDRQPARRQLTDHGAFEVSVHRHRQRARNGRGGHQQQIGARLALQQVASLQHPEAVLFVDHHQAQAGEHHLVLQQCVGSEQHVDLAAAQAGKQLAARHRLPAAGRPGAGQQRHLDSGRSENPARAAQVLAGEQLGGHDECDLFAGFDYPCGGEQGDQCLAASHIPLQQAGARQRGAQSVADLAQRLVLAAGQSELQPRSDPRRQRTAGAALGTPRRPAPPQRELQLQQLCVRDGGAGALDGAGACRKVERAHRFGHRRQSVPAAVAVPRRRHPGQAFAGGQHRAAQHGGADSLAQRIDRDDASAVRAVAGGQQLEAGRLPLGAAAMKCRRHGDDRSHRQGTRQIAAPETEQGCARGARARRISGPTGARGAGLGKGDAQVPGARAEPMLRRDLAAHDRRLAFDERRQRRDPPAILVGAREVLEQLPHRRGAQGRQAARAGRTHSGQARDPLRELVQQHRHHRRRRGGLRRATAP